nr:uncharacterized protein si:dkey-9i23.6 isoform X1 [Misgurnus anguillicaudatus]XP_055060884.1 uncharacterized protein si:dkey-9i23.6 isoform X1 [Misgurnus anguillicaudatus]
MTRQYLSYHSSLEIEEEITCKGQNEDSDVRANAVGEPQTKTLETDEAVLNFPKWERKTLLSPITMSIKTLSEDDKMLGTEEPTEIGAALYCQMESPARQSHASPFHLSTSSERHDFSQTELKNEGCDNQPKLLWCDGAAMQSTYQIHDNANNRTARSISDPVVRKPKEQRPLSAPTISEFATKNFTGNASPQKGWKDSGNEESFGELDNENGMRSKGMGMKSKLKTLTLKLMEMLKENRSREHNDSKNSQDCVEEEIESVNSMEVELEASSPPSLPPKKGRYVRLERTFTLKDFKLDLEPINLMDEIFTGEEWLPFLPSKTSQTDQDAGDMNRPEEYAQIHVSQPTTKQNQPEDNRLDKKQHINNTEETISELDSVTKVNNNIYAKEVGSDGDIIAIPKALLINPAKQQGVCGIFQSGDVFDCRGKYVIPKQDFMLMKRKSEDVSFDFSAVQSSGLLDNSALKSRIRLSKKRPHRPPKKHRKLKPDFKFYKIPSVYLKESISDSSSIDYMPISMSSPLLSNPCPAKC